MRLAAVTMLACCLFSRPVVSQSANQADPPGALWRAMKRTLSGPRGREYFEQSVKDAKLPPLYGVIVSSSPADHPKEFLVAMDGNSHPEVTLKLAGSLKEPLAVGTPIGFEGVAVAFTAEPFMLTLEVDAVNRATNPTRRN